MQIYIRWLLVQLNWISSGIAIGEGSTLAYAVIGEEGSEEEEGDDNNGEQVVWYKRSQLKQ